MDNKVKICIAIIVILILIIICSLALGGKETDETNSNTANNTTNIIENEVQNEVENENIAQNTTSVQNVVKNQKLPTQDFSSSVYEDKTEAGTISKKEEAINLVKEEWNKLGEDNTVTFSVDSITSDGIYIVAVTSKERAEVLNYFRVNLKAKTVTVDY